MDASTIRPGEVVGVVPERSDASLVFIGRIRTPFLSREDCPRQGSLDGPVCRIEIDEPWRQAMQGLEAYSRLEILYWMDKARRDLMVQAPRHRKGLAGTFALRSPMRPNPIATSIVAVAGIENGAVLVRGLDCLNGTPLLDIKPCSADAGNADTRPA
jgi:tRNA (adenine37-N6)-methyltransferase